MPRKLIKSDIVSHLNNDNQLLFPEKEAKAHVETLLELIKKTLASGEDLLISGFGKFCVKEKAPLRGRNPTTGEAMMITGRRVVTFHSSPVLQAKLNGEKIVKL